MTEEYLTYLSSDKWKQIRLAKLHESNICYVCQRSKDGDIILDIHHKTYSNFGNEKLSDLLVLCRECHELLHNQCRKLKALGGHPKLFFYAEKMKRKYIRSKRILTKGKRIPEYKHIMSRLRKMFRKHSIPHIKKELGI